MRDFPVLKTLRDIGLEAPSRVVKTARHSIVIAIIGLSSAFWTGCTESREGQRVDPEASSGTKKTLKTPSENDGRIAKIEASTPPPVVTNKRHRMPAVLNARSANRSATRGDPFAGITPGLQVTARMPNSAEMASIVNAFNNQAGVAHNNALTASLKAVLSHLNGIKIQHVEIFHELYKTKFYRGERREHVRWIWLERGKEGLKKLEGAFRASGWAREGRPITSTVKHPKYGSLVWSITDSLTQPSIVDIWIDSTIDSAMGTMMEAKALTRDDPLTGALIHHSPSMPLMGYEFGRFHFVRRGARFTEVERLSLRYGSEASKDDYKAIGEQLRAAGFKPQDDAGFRFTGEAGRTVRIRQLRDHLLVHYQRRWKPMTQRPE